MVTIVPTDEEIIVNCNESPSSLVSSLESDHKQCVGIISGTDGLIRCISDHYPDFQHFTAQFVEANDLMVDKYAINVAVQDALFDVADQLPNFNSKT